MTQQVPHEFQPLTKVHYPPYNMVFFEEFFMHYFKENQKETSWVYLPVMWTSFYIKRKYGTAPMQDLQNWLNSLDRDKKYFTVLQYDDGILQNIEGLDILIFGAGGGGKGTISENNLGTPIPLICQPGPRIYKERNTFCSFVGTTKNHSIRKQIANLFSKEFVIHDNIGYDMFVRTMERSVFSLCPRGYGATSFRICESLQHGSIPVYVYDKSWLPFADEFNFDDIGIRIHQTKIPQIYDILRSKTGEEIEQYLINGARIYKEYFTFEGCANTIIKKVC